MSSRPPFSRRSLLRAFVGCCLAFSLTACLSPQQQSVFDRINDTRTANGLRALPEHETASKHAQRWADEMARNGSLQHSDAAAVADSSWRSHAENVGYDASAEAVHQAFLDSKAHRATILGRWTHMGVGVSERNGTVYVVQLFIAID